MRFGNFAKIQKPQKVSFTMKQYFFVRLFDTNNKYVLIGQTVNQSYDKKF